MNTTSCFEFCLRTTQLPLTHKFEYYVVFNSSCSFFTDIQYNGHQSFDNNNLLYWKETKNFENGCSAHLTRGSYSGGNMALPDQGTFIIEDTSFGDGVSLEPNHHCNVGITGVLCFPQYVLHQVQWKNTNRSKKWITFQYFNTQPHQANQHHGGLFTLSPPDAQLVIEGGILENSLFPPGFVSLVSSKFTYLLQVPGSVCVLSSSISAEYGVQFDNGILCRVPLRALKMYTKGQVSFMATDLKVEMWNRLGGIAGQTGSPDASQLIGFHQIGADYQSARQGYSLPIIPGVEHSYRLSLVTADGDVPSSWVVEFSDWVLGNRFGVEYLNLALKGRTCGVDGLISSHHDRGYIWSGDEFMGDDAWGNTGACVEGSIPPSDLPVVDCATEYGNGVLPATECPELCSAECNAANSSYCECGSGTCECKPGFSGEDCSVDLCAAARCGEHGVCAATYLGGGLPVTSQACICEKGFSGHLCQYNPCEAQGKTCAGHGTCVASSEVEAECQCEDGFTGDSCELTCDGICAGSFPYSCSTQIEGIVNYGCRANGACHYLREGEDYPYDGFCTYKSASSSSACACGASNDCEVATPCNHGLCSPPEPVVDFSPCNSVPFGVCRGGVCVSDFNSSPSIIPTTSPIISVSPPTVSPTMPGNGPTYCGCDSCTQEIWDAIAKDGGGSYSCGSRIEWVQSTLGRSEHDACVRVSAEFPGGPCGPLCDPTQCNLLASKSPSRSPTPAPSMSPSFKPTTASPTSSPSKKITMNPSSSPTSKSVRNIRILTTSACKHVFSLLW
jgi:hypothetical protein